MGGGRVERGDLSPDSAKLAWMTPARKAFERWEYVHSFRQMFRHFINHSSYHRGQIVTFLRQLGTKPPSTDLILYYRRRG